jgi:hypothetical protein
MIINRTKYVIAKTLFENMKM